MTSNGSHGAHGRHQAADVDAEFETRSLAPGSTDATFTLGTALREAGLDLDDVMVIRHAYVPIHKDGEVGLHATSTDGEILQYTSRQSRSTNTFPSTPARYWVVLLPDGGSRARLWDVLELVHEIDNDGAHRLFKLRSTGLLADLRSRLVLAWPLPRRWWVKGPTGAKYSVVEVRDPDREPFPGFDGLVVDYPKLQAIVLDPRYVAWREVLASVVGVYLITDMTDGKQYVGKADGAENILQRWTAYATNGHGGNVELKKRSPHAFRFSVLRVFDPTVATLDVNAVESHYKQALGSRVHGLNAN